MLLERTISQLDLGPLPPERAAELARMGYLQWLAALPGRAAYAPEARRALALSAPFAASSPAVAGFRALIEASLRLPPQPLALDLPARQRRGGAQGRRRLA